MKIHLFDTYRHLRTFRWSLYVIIHPQPGQPGLSLYCLTFLRTGESHIVLACRAVREKDMGS